MEIAEIKDLGYGIEVSLASPPDYDTTVKVVIDRMTIWQIYDYCKDNLDRNPPKVDIKGLAELVKLSRKDLRILKGPKYNKIPIIIQKWNDGEKGWRAELPYNYDDYKPSTYGEINFEDLSFHFNHETETHEKDYLLFKTRKDAVEAAKYCNKTFLNGKAKIWFIH